MVYWKYTLTKCTFIIARDTEKKLERCVWDSEGGSIDNKWYAWDYNTLKDERQYNKSFKIDRISEKEFFLEVL